MADRESFDLDAAVPGVLETLEAVRGKDEIQVKGPVLLHGVEGPVGCIVQHRFIGADKSVAHARLERTRRGRLELLQPFARDVRVPFVFSRCSHLSSPSHFPGWSAYSCLSLGAQLI